MHKLSRDFFSRDTLIVARELLGKLILFEGKKLIITETECYKGEGDEASHSAKGLTERNQVMFGPAGFAYVYLIYGVHHCLNFVTEAKGVGSAVLIRGAILSSERDEANLRSVKSKVINGPGKLCKILGITTESHNGIDIISEENFSVQDIGNKLDFYITKRIGINKAKDLPWRFVAKI